MKSSFYPRFVYLSCLAIGISLCSTAAYATSITATAIGLTDPGIVTADRLDNGDFIISPNGILNPLPTNNSLVLGDGLNEFHEWLFDFNDDPNFKDFSFDTPIKSAVLTLTLEANGTFTDAISWIGLRNFCQNTPGETCNLIPGFPNSSNSPVTVQFDLLDAPRSVLSSEILDILQNSSFGPGVAAFQYQDDAIVSFAELEITSMSSIPEPNAVFGILTVGLLLGALHGRFSNLII